MSSSSYGTWIVRLQGNEIDCNFRKKVSAVDACTNNVDRYAL